MVFLLFSLPRIACPGRFSFSSTVRVSARKRARSDNPYNLALVVYQPPARFLFSYAHSAISKEEIEDLWTGYRT